MIAQTGPALYRLNLIRELREKEVKSERKRRMTLILGLGCFGFFVLSLLYSGLTIWQMEAVLNREEKKVQDLHQEYQKYKASKLIVDKADLELLSGLQGKGIFWTKKLVAIAKHLPENYSITSFSYGNDQLKVTGYGATSAQQDQLLVLDNYLNRLRADTSFSNTFKQLQLNSADRRIDAGQIAFEFTAFTSGKKKKK
jgi:Tfp pilus assembly protein PilN